ncbi:hypothetical protein O9G_002185 [Rozella allomycis CSF55]|uniref:Uncharacterized protein n=1 Tax=Rozella allomycis (strain CSF55) TaxID=988480 RepID=A0A075AQB4_ROZAC|nr:hypothetical protein O9G_002185 [Rozella allomycis CSF55]|eukprot:EPZ32345.1 hypothetical protein O9G_002185 [Rozella allomycis CSF55]
MRTFAVILSVASTLSTLNAHLMADIHVVKENHAIMKGHHFVDHAEMDILNSVDLRHHSLNPIAIKEHHDISEEINGQRHKLLGFDIVKTRGGCLSRKKVNSSHKKKKILEANIVSVEDSEKANSSYITPTEDKEKVLLVTQSVIGEGNTLFPMEYLKYIIPFASLVLVAGVGMFLKRKNKVHYTPLTK